jgi:hypothetical protein
VLGLPETSHCGSRSEKMAERLSVKVSTAPTQQQIADYLHHRPFQSPFHAELM